MRNLSLVSAAAAASLFIPNVFSSALPARVARRAANSSAIAPKVVIVDMFSYEEAVWYGIKEFNVLENNITVPGMSPLYPQIHCTSSGEICQFTTGEAEINAATTVTALVRSSLFDFTSTYFMIGGIAGVNPEVATTGSVAFSRFAVQTALQYEISQLELPSNFTTGYIPFGTTIPYEYPTSIYGTEVFEFNENLQQMAIAAASKAKLSDNPIAKKYRANYAADPAYAAGAAPPSVVACDTATSDVWFSGNILSSTMGNITTVLTNGTGIYCMTAQEDNASAEAFLRAAVDGLVDFSRIILMRTGSDMDRQYPGEAATTNLFWANEGAFEPALKNIYRAGIKVVEMILKGWDETFEAGVTPSNYIGDIFGTLGGTPDFGPYTSAAEAGETKRSVPERMTRRSQLFA